MNDFDYENKEKKAIARGAFHKKNGSKSKGCHLPSDDLTSAQRKKLNGPCVTVKLGQPMTWAEFKSLRHDLQQTYYDQCFEYYGPTLTAFAEMMGANIKTVQIYFCRSNLHVRSNRRYRMSDAQKKMWAAFCNGVVGGESNRTHINITPEVSAPINPLPEYQDPQIIPPAVKDTVLEAATINDAVLEAATINDNSKDIDQLRFERDFYKERYFELLAILSERK